MENAPRENVDVNRSGPAEAIVPALKVVKSFGRLRPFRRCTILCPTWVGFWCITAVLFTLVAGWFTYGESFLVETHRSQADILVVEGCIGRAPEEALWFSPKLTRPTAKLVSSAGNLPNMRRRRGGSRASDPRNYFGKLSVTFMKFC